MPGISLVASSLEIFLPLETFIMQTINFQKEYDGIDLVVHLQIMSVGNSSFSNAYRRHHYLFTEIDVATLISRYTSNSFSQARSCI